MAAQPFSKGAMSRPRGGLYEKKTTERSWRGVWSPTTWSNSQLNGFSVAVVRWWVARGKKTATMGSWSSGDERKSQTSNPGRGDIVRQAQGTLCPFCLSPAPERAQMSLTNPIHWTSGCHLDQVGATKPCLQKDGREVRTNLLANFYCFDCSVHSRLYAPRMQSRPGWYGPKVILYRHIFRLNGDIRYISVFFAKVCWICSFGSMSHICHKHLLNNYRYNQWNAFKVLLISLYNSANNNVPFLLKKYLAPLLTFK